jgi:polyisoprenoid-binding protein YceI
MASAQSTNYILDKNSKMVIKGTSTIHDWEADVEQMNVNMKLAPARLQQDTMANPVESFSITVPVESIESGKGRMNGKIYDALKKNDHPQIEFTLKSAELMGANASPGSFTLNSTGMLTVAGNSKQVTFPVTATRVNVNSFRFKGSYSLNMKDYDVDPPSAMLGTIRSGEEVTIEFDIAVRK